MITYTSSNISELDQLDSKTRDEFSELGIKNTSLKIISDMVSMEDSGNVFEILLKISRSHKSMFEIKSGMTIYLNSDDDVIFNKEFTNGLVIPFNASQSVSELEFTIPQGEYKRVDIGFRTFDDNGDLCILVEGNYTYTAGSSIPFRFEFYDAEQFRIRAEDNNGGNILLDKDVTSPAKIVLDPNHWFQPVPTSYFENADVSNISGTNTILIDKNNNDIIYDIVLDRLDESALIVFNY